MNEETKHLISLLYTDNLSQYGKRKLADIVENQQNRIDELEKALIEVDFKYRNKINKLKDKLKIDKEKMQTNYDDNEMNYYKQIDYILKMLEG